MTSFVNTWQAEVESKDADRKVFVLEHGIVRDLAKPSSFQPKGVVCERWISVPWNFRPQASGHPCNALNRSATSADRGCKSAFEVGR